MKKIIFPFIVLSLFSLLGRSQTFTKQSLIGGDELVYTCSYADNKYTSNFKILKNNVLRFESNYLLDTSINHYRLLQHKKLSNWPNNLIFH